MFDVISPFVNLLWPIILALAGLLGLFMYGNKKKREGKAAERKRAEVARDAAADEAAKIRDKAAAKTPDTKRKETERWEK